MKTFIIMLLFLCNFAFATTKQADVVYGVDNRKDIYEVSSRLFIELYKGTAAHVPNSSIKPVGNKFQITGATLEQRGMCKKEKFSDQITAARCSGFLIGKDLIATAGHCVTSPSDCSANSWVFDYSLTKKDQKEIIVGADSIYKCKKVIKSVVDDETKNDFAIIQLDREVKDRKFLLLRRSGSPKVKDSVVVIGHPTGLPSKVSDGARIRSLKSTHFIANLDTYGGNSGSAVFSTRTGFVEGILVRGENDYVRSPEGCMVSNVCTETGCRGEDVTYSKSLFELLSTIR